MSEPLKHVSALFTAGFTIQLKNQTSFILATFLQFMNKVIVYLIEQKKKHVLGIKVLLEKSSNELTTATLIFRDSNKFFFFY